MIPHNKPTLGPRELNAVKRVIESEWLAQASEVAAFENELCEFFGIEKGHAIVVSSGSAALFLALWALGCKGERVGVPVYSCCALRNAVEMVGAKSVYLDCSEGSPNADISTANSAAIDTLIAPSMFGIPIEVDKTRNYKLIEDLAQSFGATDRDNPIGLRGNLGICSFYASKLITSGGQGGAIISKDKSLIDLIRDYREFDNRRDDKIRFNFQMTDIQAAIGREQLEQFSEFSMKRDVIFDVYKNAGLDLIDIDCSNCKPVRYRAVLQTDKPLLLIQKLKEIGVNSIVPIEAEELLDNSDKYPNANWFANNTISLPIYPDLNNKIAHKIADCLRLLIKEK